jgi:superfamily II DNA/RNA helicase
LRTRGRPCRSTLTPRTGKILTTFKELGALPEIADALERVGITTAFPIQEMTLPVALMGTDLIGQARTGTGKTLAFGIPVLQRTVAPHDADHAELVEPDKPQALIVAPTRELALQVAGDLSVAAADRGTRVLTVYGGVGYDNQLNTLASGVDVVVGTPGRLLDLVNRRALNLAHVKVLVLDEADEMLDLGFLPDVERLIARTPETRQTMLFSATMPGAIVSLARTHMRHPMNIRAESSDAQQTVPATAQFIYQVHDLDKPQLVAKMLQAENSGLTLVFTRTKRAAQRLADDLEERGFETGALHGDMQQVSRERALKKFRDGKLKVLVATDVAARGIDVTDITHVVNYSCPEDDKTYVHRIGRTGRAGASGIAVTFVDWADVTRWKVINRVLDLPFDDPTETYSTSENFLHDMGIPPDATGRLVPPSEVKVERKDARQGGGRGDRGGQGERGDRPASNDRQDRPRRNRNRNRTRSGEPVQGEPTPNQGAANAQAGEGQQGNRSRNRRRRSRGGGKPANAPSGD